ncbi:MAG TPA: hypothetical protein P5102_00825 [Candidatus Competibacteraceae bacterium]|nr:hypothetical protein [Candidatus Competibacteraceae bacterium]HRZ04690.1 hypothetical protein [Candidatus Competibacteraceae bacterium]HSA45035.1 hypothetical protein [Candidatus Competibacteraceae bacterium]
MTEFLAATGSLIVIVGTLFLSQATIGVGIICIGCFIGILARIAQASAHHKQATNGIADKSSS